MKRLNLSAGSRPLSWAASGTASSRGDSTSATRRWNTHQSESEAGRSFTRQTNGTLALDSCAKAKLIYLGTLLGLSALARELLQLKPDHLLLVCAGTHSHFALEDGIAAGALVAKLVPHASPFASARACLAIWRSVKKDPTDTLAVTRNALRLKSVGLDQDVDYCSQFDAIDRVARVEKGEVRLVTS